MPYTSWSGYTMTAVAVLLVGFGVLVLARQAAPPWVGIGELMLAGAVLVRVWVHVSQAMPSLSPSDFAFAVYSALLT